MGRKTLWVTAVVCVSVLVMSLIAAGCESSSDKPKIESLSPNSGEASSQIVINGEGFGATQGTGTVHFANTLADETAWGDASISVKVPENLAPAVYPVTVTTKDGASNEMEFTVTPKATPLPIPVKITSLQPSSGVAGTQVVASGTNFGANKGKILFGPGTAEVVSWSETSVTFKVPANAAPNTYGVKVNTAEGTKSNEAIYELHAAPQPDLSAQLQAIAIYIGYSPEQAANWPISLKKKSAIDPNWEVVDVVVPVEPGVHRDALLVWNNMLGDWECLSMEGPPWTGVEFKGEQVPSDLKGI